MDLWWRPRYFTALRGRTKVRPYDCLATTTVSLQRLLGEGGSSALRLSRYNYDCLATTTSLLGAGSRRGGLCHIHPRLLRVLAGLRALVREVEDGIRLR